MKKIFIPLTIIALLIALISASYIMTSAAGTIMVDAEKMIVLGDQNKYLILEPGTIIEDIPPASWESPSGVFQSDSEISAAGNIVIASIVPVKIGKVFGAGDSIIEIFEGSNITVETSEATAIDVGTLAVSSAAATKRTYLSAVGGTSGISLARGMSSFMADITTTGESYGFQWNVEDEMNGSHLSFSHETNVVARASGADGIAIRGDYLECYGSKIDAKASNGVFGIKLNTSFSVMELDEDEKNTISEVNAFSKTGRAISVGANQFSGSMQVSGSKVFAETTEGEAGIHCDSLNASASYTTNVPSIIEGRANIGYGVVGQSIDSDQEFPSGGINVYDSVVKGYVKEGMGLSSFMMSAYGQIAENELEGIAEKGIGISACNISITNAKIKAISRGSTTKHFQVYDSIADSAGINFLSSFNMGGNVEIEALAPMNDPNSFGIHGLLNDAEGSYRNSYLYIYESEEQSVDINAKGGVGIYVGTSITTNTYSNSTININAHGSYDGIQTETLSAYADKTSGTNEINIVTTGEQGAGIRIIDSLQYSINYVNLNSCNIKATGKEYGVLLGLSDGSIVDGVTLTAFASDGDAVKIANRSENDVTTLSLESSTIHAVGGRYGLTSNNIDITFKNTNADSVSTFRVGKLHWIFHLTLWHESSMV